MSGTDKKIILGVQEAHDASAAIMVAGKIVGAVQEERFTGLKGDYGLPINSIKYLLNEVGIEGRDLDEVCLASHTWNPVLTKIKRNANFSVQDWIDEQNLFWYEKIFNQKEPIYYDIFKNKENFVFDDLYPCDHLLRGYHDENEMKEMKSIRKQVASEIIKIDISKIRTITHEDCHNYYAFFGSHIRENSLGFTSEGIGDYSNQAVFSNSLEKIKLLDSSKECHLGHIYQYIALILGMKPNQHEYKVMGLAPYANDYETTKSYEHFKKVQKVDELKVIFNEKPEDLYFHFKKCLEGHRFDGIAGAVQLFVENILCELIENAIKKTGLSKIVFSGGVSQNIKANMAIHSMKEVEDFYVCPAAGDTSLPIGACYVAMAEECERQKISKDFIRPIENIYLGPSFEKLFEEKCIKEHLDYDEFSIRDFPGPEKIAQLITEGMILGRCVERMEFGLRALGNRSIIADPRNIETIERINRAIKFRDFWMPFTPSIISERAEDYIINPKNIQSPFMTMAFHSKPRALKDLVAAIHPADKTIRPQILFREQNPKFYDIIKSFEAKTGVGAILNTSFNLHGKPIVLGPKDAIITLKNSGLDGLILNNFLILRKKNKH